MDEFWMNPRKPMGAQWQGNAGFLGEREQTRKTLPATPPGTTDEFINGQWVPRGDPLRRENMMIPPPMRDRYPAELGPDGQMQLRQAANAGVDMGGPATPPGTTDEFMNNEWVPHQFNMESISTPVEELLTYNQEPIPQIQRPARKTREWPWGQSIADSFNRGVTGLSNLVGRGMDQLIPPAY